MPQNKRESLRMLVAQNLGENARRHIAKFPERGGAKLQVQFVNDIFGGIAIQMLEQNVFNRIFPAGQNILPADHGMMELPQHFFHHFLRHGLQIHDRLGNFGNLRALHPFEHFRGKFVAHSQKRMAIFSAPLSCSLFNWRPSCV
jgi:hypothetical protein